MGLMEWALLASIIAGAAASLFILVYLVLARWWRSQEGVNVMLLAVIIVLAAGLSIVGRLGLVDAARVGAIVVWFGVAVVFVWRTGLLLRAQGVLNRRRSPDA